MKQRLSNDQRGIASIFELMIVVIVISAIGFVGYKVHQAKNNPKDNSSQNSQNLSDTRSTFELNESIKLHLNQTATIKDGNEVIKFRFKELKPPGNPKAKCEELCSDWLPTIMTELQYANKTFKGTGASGTIDMSFEDNGAYALVPYNIELVNTDFKSSSGTVKITKTKFTKIELGKPFTLEDGGIAALVPGKTGVSIMFGVCGFNSSCIRQVDFFVDDKYVSTESAFSNTWIDQDNQNASKDGSYVEHNGLRLRLIESDDKTYATFVLENK